MTGRELLCGGKSWGERDATRLLKMAAVGREHKPPAVQDAVGDDLDEGGRHDRARGLAFIQRLDTLHGVTVLLDKARDDVCRDVTGRRLCNGRRREASSVGRSL